MLTIRSRGLGAACAVLIAASCALLPTTQTSAATGGPDGGGYYFTDSDEIGGPVYSWIDISGTGTLSTAGDTTHETVTLPFTFPYYGTDHTEVTIDGDGALNFGTDEAVSAYVSCLPSDNPSGGDALIAALLDDLDPEDGNADGVYYETIGAAPDQVFVVSFLDVPQWYGDLYFTFQILLYEATHEIVVQYNHVTDGNYVETQGAEAVVGIQGDPSTGLDYSCNTASLDDGLAILYYQSGCDDADNDTYTSCDGDCDDGDATINPGMAEVCDGIDNDCIEATDENRDRDGDGYSPCDGDCDDLDAAIGPDAVEDCGDGIDNDCDGDVDGDDTDCASDDDSGDDDSGDDDSGDDDSGDDDSGDDDDSSGETDDDSDDGDDDSDDGPQDCNCRQDGLVRHTGAAAPLALLALTGLFLLRRR